MLYKLNYKVSSTFFNLSTTGKSQNSYPSTRPKCYWTLLKALLNGRKIPCFFLTPLFHDNKCITDFKEKSKIFNFFFVH